MSLNAAQIEDRLKQALPRAKIAIHDPRGDGLYLAITVTDKSFAGISRVEQHRIVYKAIGEDVIDPPPSISINTVVGK